MSFTELTILASKTNYYWSYTRPDSAIRYIVIHYTANDGDTAENNAKYFQGANRHASAHIFVDNYYAVHSVPRNHVAWSVGGSKYSDCAKTGGGRYYGKCTNANSLSIELCGTGKGTKASAKTIANAIELTLYYMQKLNIDADHVIRHFDVTGKSCPAYWTDDRLWEKEFHSKLVKASKKAKKKASKHSYYKEKGQYKIVKVPRVIRASASSKAKIVGYIRDHNVYTVTGVKSTSGVTYGKLKSGAGWVCLRKDYVKKV